jgi:hypothetical protein
MTSKHQFLIELISEAANDNKPDVTTWLAWKLTKECANTNAHKASRTQQALQLEVQPVAGPSEIFNAVCHYISRYIGAKTKYELIANYIEHDSGLTLDRYSNKSRERWRQQVSDVVQKLVELEILSPTQTRSHYNVVRHP